MKDKRIKKRTAKLLAENFPHMMKALNTETQLASTGNMRSIPRHIIIHSFKIGNERNVARRKNRYTTKNKNDSRLGI